MRLLGVVALAACLAVACATAVNTRTLLRRAASRYSWEPDPGATQVANPPPYWKPGPEWQKADSGVYYKFPEPGKGDWKKGFCVSKPDVTQAEMSSLSERQWLTDLMWFLGQGCNAGNKYHVRSWEGKGMLNDCASTVGLVFFDCCFQGKWTVIPRQGNEVYASNCEKLYRVRQWWDALAGEDGAAFCVCSQTRDYIRRRMANFASKLDDPRNLQPPPSISGDEPPASFSAAYPTPSSSAQVPKKKKNRSYSSNNNGLSSASDSDPTPSWANNNGKSRNAASWGLNSNSGGAAATNNNNNNKANQNGNGNTQSGTVANKTPGSPTAAPAPAPAPANNNNNNNQQKQGSPTQAPTNGVKQGAPTQAPTNGVKQGAPQSPTASVNGVKQGSPQTSASQTVNKTAGAAPGQNPVKAQVLSGNNSTSSNNNNNNNGNTNNSPSSNGSGSSSSSPSSNGDNISGSGGSGKQDSPLLTMSKDDSMTIITNDNSMIHKESHMAGH